MTSIRTAGTRRPNSLRAANLTIANTTTNRNTNPFTRSIEMYTMHEALARERMRVTHRDSQQLRVARELASARRWHRLEVRAHAASRRARAAERRHALRAL
ncbi:MAG: hypothetical protein M3Y44_16555 [Actinomycetota bacterium]|nr:hypothetical protein [Actinomycetota bacterium]